MKKLILALALAPALASAQFQVQAGASFTLDLPTIVPPLVVIQPGIQVVPDVDVEVFHADGFYWTRHQGAWYRSSNPRSGWVHHPKGVPPGLSRLPPGQYKRWKGRGGPSGPAYHDQERRGDDRHEKRHDEHGGKGKKGGKKH
jgi:hypothetical protein